LSPGIAATSLFDTYLAKSEDAMQQGEATKAEELAKSAEDEAKLSGNEQQRMNALYMQSIALKALKKYRESERIVTQIVSDPGYVPDDLMLARLNLVLGDDLLAEKRWTAAEKALRKSLDTVEGSPDLRLRLRSKIVTSLADVYEKQGKTTQAEALRSTVSTPALPDTVSSTGSMMIVIDSSAQTTHPLGEITSIDLAKQSIENLMARIPTNVNLGLRIVGGSDSADECTNTKLLIPIGADNRTEIIDAVRHLKPMGKCPLMFGLLQASEHDIATISGPKAILLFAIGHDECRDLPSEIQDAVVPINFISMGSAESADQFRRIALGTKGNTWSAYELRRFLVTDVRFSAPVSWPQTFEKQHIVIKDSSTLHVPVLPHIPRSQANEVETLNVSSASNDWLIALCKKIKHVWLPPKGTESKESIVIFDVDKSGQVSHLRLDHSSGSQVADQAALHAIESASPLPVLPPSMGNKATIRFTFAFNLYGLGGNADIATP
jgi:TonB family protein